MAVTKISLGRQSDLNANGGIITNVGTPSAGTDAVNKNYVDNATAGLSWKAAVRVATTANGTLASAFANGSTVDGVTLATGDRILLKNQTTAADNGIYTVNASGAPTRATDADTAAELLQAAVFVQEGTTNADTAWVNTTNAPITVGSTSLTFAQFSGGAGITAGAGLTLTGTTIDVVSGNGGIVVNANNITLTAADASLTINSSGIKQTPGTAGQVSLTNGSGVVTPTTLSGDVSSVSATGSVTLASGVTKMANIITRETPSGAVNGSNTAFTLANTPLAGTEEVYLNGLLQEPGAGNDYTISGATITYLTAPITGDRIRVSYRK